MMMEGASSGGMLYHEVQESKLCAVHCVNTVLQGPFFSEFDLAALASDLDRKERQVMLPALSSSDFESHNVSLDGDFSLCLLSRTRTCHNLQQITSKFFYPQFLIKLNFKMRNPNST
ncbi:ataxin-3 homolog [Vigna angularis]|nr:ataxin-3 homolog [Vigna angularis]